MKPMKLAPQNLEDLLQQDMNISQNINRKIVSLNQGQKVQISREEDNNSEEAHSKGKKLLMMFQ